jgi:hypothetical protein
VTRDIFKPARCGYTLKAIVSPVENYPWIGTDKKIFFVL